MKLRDAIISGLNLVRLRGDNRLRHLVFKLTGIAPVSTDVQSHLVELGVKVGLSPAEVKAATEVLPETVKPLPRWMAWLIFTGALVLGVTISAVWLNFVRYSTYIPGTRYGALSPKDFSE